MNMFWGHEKNTEKKNGQQMNDETFFDDARRVHQAKWNGVSQNPIFRHEKINFFTKKKKQTENIAIYGRKSLVAFSLQHSD